MSDASLNSNSPVPKNWPQLFSILCIGLGLRLFYFVGVGGHDDISYFGHAIEVLNGSFSTAFEPGGSFPFRFRVGLIYPTALMFRLFGVSEYTAAIFPLLNSMGLILLSWWAGRRISASTGALAAFLMATFPLDIVQATTLLPTPFAAFLTGLAVMLWLTAADRNDGIPATGSLAGHPDNGLSRISSNWLYVAAGLCLGTAYLFRFEALLFAMFFVAYVICFRRCVRGLFLTGAASVLVVGAENVVYWSAHGEWLYHLKALSGGFANLQGKLAASVSNRKSPMEYVWAIFVKPSELGLHWFLIFPAALWATRKSRKDYGPLLLWFWPVALYLFFGSWSLSHYVPTSKNPRYLMNVTIPGLVMLAGLIDTLLQRGGRIRLMTQCGLVGLIAGSFVLLNLTWVYRTENASGGRLAAQFIQAQTLADAESSGGNEALRDKTKPIYAEHYSACNLLCFLPDRNIVPVSVHDQSIGQNGQLLDVDQITDGVVVIDRFVMEKYIHDVEMVVPEYLLHPPDHWKLQFTADHPQDKVAYGVVLFLNRFLGRVLSGPERSLKPTPVSVYTVTRPATEAGRSPEGI